MRKLIAVLILVLAVAYGYGMFRCGVRHAMVDSEVWIYGDEDPATYDFLVHIEIDGDWYEHGVYLN